MNYTCDRRRGAGTSDAPGGQVGEVGDGDTRDEVRTRSERLVIQSRNTELQDALTGRGTASCATEDARFPAHLATPEAGRGVGPRTTPTATGPRSQRHGTNHNRASSFPSPNSTLHQRTPSSPTKRRNEIKVPKSDRSRSAHVASAVAFGESRKLAAARAVCIYLYHKLFERKAVYDTKTRITIGATAHLMMCVDGNTLGSLLDTATRTHEETRGEP